VGEFIINAVNIIFLVILSFAFFKFIPTNIKNFYWPGLLAKYSCGILYGLLYLHYYDGGDTFSYFNQGVLIADIGRNDVEAYLRFLFFNENEKAYDLAFSSIYHSRSFWMIKALSPFLILTADNYWITACYFSLFGYLGIFYLVSTLIKIYPARRFDVLICFFLFPSFVFWSSGFTKESLAIGSLFYLIGFSIKMLLRIKISKAEFILLPILLFIEWRVRVFYLSVFLLTIGIYLLFNFLSRKFKLSLAQKLVILGSSGFIFILAISQMDYSLNFSNFLEVLTYAYYDDYNKNPSNAIRYYNLEPSIFSLIINAPYALISGLFRPFIFDAQTWPMILVGIENLILLVLFIFNIKSFKKNYTSLEWTLWIYTFLLALFLALSSPNFGTLTRYKVAFLPIFLFLVLKENPILNKVGKGRIEGV